MSTIARASGDDWDGLWADYGDSSQVNPAQEYRRRLLLRRLRVGGMSRVVDIGSGQGDLALMLRRTVPSVEIVGLELGASGIEQARAKVPNARFVQTDLLRRQTPGELAGWGTHATCSEVLEHVDRPEWLLHNAAVYLARGARLVVTVPGGPRTAFDRHIGHRRHFTAASLRTVLERAGFAVERVEAAGFPFFNLYRLVVWARGRRLIDDVRGGAASAGASAANAVQTLFRPLFHFNLPNTPFGWQLVAVARKR